MSARRLRPLVLSVGVVWLARGEVEGERLGRDPAGTGGAARRGLESANSKGVNANTYSFWTKDQSAALCRVDDWLRERDGEQVFKLHGFAGTGKSTLAIEIGSEVQNVAYATPTGKARVRLIERGAPSAHTSTIHRLIYSATRDPTDKKR